MVKTKTLLHNTQKKKKNEFFFLFGTGVSVEVHFFFWCRNNWVAKMEKTGGDIVWHFNVQSDENGGKRMSGAKRAFPTTPEAFLGTMF